MVVMKAEYWVDLLVHSLAALMVVVMVGLLADKMAEQMVHRRVVQMESQMVDGKA